MLPYRIKQHKIGDFGDIDTPPCGQLEQNAHLRSTLAWVY
jgi:hypothetical protein